MLPLINVVFLLLIFFMLAGRLAATDAFRVEPPRSLSRGAVEIPETVVLVGADGRIALDGVVVDEDGLRASLSHRMASGTKPRVRLKADGRAIAQRIVVIMELLREVGVEELELLTVLGGR